ncbi:MAG: hypothetical protein Ct9H300mP4_15240 [Gammaproteobacteria bacterium]|nr:MAG: hypothetical protein Ct9H300mP4_15240 [Gammaproteobacteria bacterium]
MDDGHVVYESTIINEYLEEKFPQIPLMPKTSQGKARVRKWTLQLDTNIPFSYKCTNYLHCLSVFFLAMSPEDLELHFNNQPGADPLKIERHNDNIKKGLIQNILLMQS